MSRATTSSPTRRWAALLVGLALALAGVATAAEPVPPPAADRADPPKGKGGEGNKPTAPKTPKSPPATPAPPPKAPAKAPAKVPEKSGPLTPAPTTVPRPPPSTGGDGIPFSGPRPNPIATPSTPTAPSAPTTSPAPFPSSPSVGDRPAPPSSPSLPSNPALPPPTATPALVGATQGPGTSPIGPVGRPVFADAGRHLGTGPNLRPAGVVRINQVTPDRDVHRPDGRRDGESARDRQPPHRSSDHRYARPAASQVRASPDARYQPPESRYYRNYYTRWYVHPYYRYQYATSAMVGFGYPCDPWYDAWAPPGRAGWMWVPGHWAYGWWHPGYWAPLGNAPLYGYTYVPGFWYGANYVDGYYRPEARSDGGWEWIEGYYLEDGVYVWGYWKPTTPGPQGYVWEPGFYDGEAYIDGFWRPQFRTGYTWTSAWYDEQGIFHAGYWMPTEAQAGFTWIPGWFDGNEWVAGYWVPDAEYESADTKNYTPAAGWDAGWEVGGGWGDGAVVNNRTGEPTPAAPETAATGTSESASDRPLAVPVERPR
jgi:hypothetical protein